MSMKLIVKRKIGSSILEDRVNSAIRTDGFLEVVCSNGKFIAIALDDILNYELIPNERKE